MAKSTSLFIVTGMSGAGKSVALKTLEDLGYEAVDNLPLSFLPALLQSCESGPGPQHLAIGIDIRNRDFVGEHFEALLEELRASNDIALKMLFLDADDEVLRRRFTETRRKHPITEDRPITDSIIHERSLIEPMRNQADLVLDTSDFTAADLRRWIKSQLTDGATPSLTITLTSFAYMHGVPREADLVFDVRFLQNPHYIPELKEFTGCEAKVGEYIARDPIFPSFFDHLGQLVLPLLPRYLDEGKSYLTIAIGCTGGKHRSVFVVESLAKLLQSQGYNITIKHRELQLERIADD